MLRIQRYLVSASAFGLLVLGTVFGPGAGTASAADRLDGLGSLPMPVKIKDALEHSGADYAEAMRVLRPESHHVSPQQECTITGTPADETLDGTEGDDVICGVGGADRIRGYGGDDIIIAGDSAGSVLGNSINPGPGNDVVFGGPGIDTISCAQAPPCEDMGDGNDVVHLGGGNDGGDMGDGDDVVDGGPGRDVIWGQGDDDELIGGGGGDVIFAGPGNDYLEANNALSSGISLDGDAGNDVIVSIDPTGFPGTTTASGGDGNDLAVLLDGSIDGFQPGEGFGAPMPGTPCSFNADEETVSVSCELLEGLSIAIDSEGAVTYSSEIEEVAAMVKAIWEDGGPVADTCYCDERVAGFPTFSDIIL